MNTTARMRSTEGIDGKDAVGLYLDAIAKTALLTALEEVELARTIEAGLFAEHVLDGRESTSLAATDDELREAPHEVVADCDLSQIGVRGRGRPAMRRRQPGQHGVGLHGRVRDQANTPIENAHG